jgi:4a-hydroxytetrahydrobiopterin dehydratase
MNTLSENEVAGALEPLQAWTLVEGALQWQHRFSDFVGAFAFLTQVALLAEKADHHPDVTLSYNHLTLRLVSHDAGGITERDLELARALSALKTA